MENVREKIQEIVKRIFGAEIEVELTEAPAETGADYATNVALKLAKIAHKSPMMIAEEIKTELEKADAGENGERLEVERVEIAAPGFLNFISPGEYYIEKVQGYAQDLKGNLQNFISQDEYSGKTVVAEFSDPNPFKVLHVGHLYTSIVGDSISRLLEKAGAKVVRANFGGDVGMHVAKTLWALTASANSLSKRSSAQEQDAKSSSFARFTFSANLPDAESAQGTGLGVAIEEIAKCYVEGTRAYEEDEAARAEIKELNKIIYDLAELGEEKCRERLALEAVAEDYGRSTAEIAQIAELYWAGRKLSYEYFEDFYAQIGVKFDKFYPESTVVDKGREEVLAHVGTTYEESEGAIVFRGEKVGLHTRVFINAEGVPTYETKDVGLIFTKWEDWHFDESVVITGNEQSDYMKVVLASVKEYAPELVERTRHLTHGLVKLKGGVKMSSRKGNFLKAVEVIQLVNQELAITSSVEARPQRLPSQGCGARPRRNSGSSPEESCLIPTNQMITLAALKYAFLKYKMGGDIVFDPEESVSMTGNSGVYLLYSAVRAKKILQKLEKSAPVEKKRGEEQEKWVKRLSKKIVQYEEILAQAVREKAPYKVCGYLYELAQEFSRFYENVPVVGNEEEGKLREIVRGYLAVMEDGLGVLGIEVPEEM